MSENPDALPTKLVAYQNQCFDGDEYTGFRCPNNDPNCPIKAGDGMEIIDAMRLVGCLMEFAHDPSTPKSKTGTSYPDQGRICCGKCHTNEHASNPSSSRLPRSRKI